MRDRHCEILAEKVIAVVKVCLSTFLVFLSIAVVQCYAAPGETSHWNSNTFDNLNALADKTAVTFKIVYNDTGTITWYRDGAAQTTCVSTTSAQYTTSWATTGMHQVKARMTSPNGTSAETVWPVEVRDSGDATLEYWAYNSWEDRLRGYRTIHVTNGWVNYPTLYLKTKEDPDRIDWITYVSSGTYIVDTNIRIADNAVLKADDGSARVIRMRALPLQNTDQRAPGCLVADRGGAIRISSMTFAGWDMDLGAEIANDKASAEIIRDGNGDNTSTLQLTCSEFRHIYVTVIGDETSGTFIDNNNFLEGNQHILFLWSCKHKRITNNLFYGGRVNLFWCNGEDNTIQGNRFIGVSSPNWGSDLIFDTVDSRLIGNEFTLAGWNNVEVGVNAFTRDNTIHDTGGVHNGFNNMFNNVYSYNDYCYNIEGGFAGFESQVTDTFDYPVAWENFPQDIYVINGHAKNADNSFGFAGTRDVYFYNFTNEQSMGMIEFGTYNFFIRKSRFMGSKEPATDPALYIVDCKWWLYRYLENVTLLDTVFSGSAAGDIGYYPAGSGVINVINCIRRQSGGTITEPDSFLSMAQVEEGSTPEVRNYAWLDVLVKDQNGVPVNGAVVTVESLTANTSSATLKVTLPPPPPDLWDLPASRLPQPVLENYNGLTTRANGKIPGPNYGWSADPVPCAALLFSKIFVNGSSAQWAGNYQYRIKATWHGLEASLVVTPDSTWLREDPTVSVNTVQLVLNGVSSLVTDTTPPTLTITAPQNDQTVSGTVAVAATASDNWDIDRLEIFVDNNSRAVISASSCTCAGGSYSCSWNWDTSQESDGTHRIKIIAHDISGYTTEKTVTVVKGQASPTDPETTRRVVVYPNPYIKGRNGGAQKVTLAHLPADATISIYTLAGDLLATIPHRQATDGGSEEWDVSGVASGVYLYAVTSGGPIRRGKICIVK